jgi:hypothetical protein
LICCAIDLRLRRKKALTATKHLKENGNLLMFRMPLVFGAKISDFFQHEYGWIINPAPSFKATNNTMLLSIFAQYGANFGCV